MMKEEGQFVVPDNPTTSADNNGNNGDNNNNSNNTGNNAKPPKKYSVKFKRSRSSRACEVCHSRKVRCDAMIHIPCTNCLTFGCECKFPEPKIRKNAKKKKEVDDNNNIIENKDSTANGKLKTESLNSSSIPSSAGSSIREGLHTKPTPSSSTSQQPASITIHSKKKNEPVAAVSAQSAKIDQSKFSQKMSSNSFIGTSSTANLLNDRTECANTYRLKDEFVPPKLRKTMEKTRMGLDVVQMEILRVRGAFLLPEKQLCDDLVYTFFDRIYPNEPVLDKPKFMKDYEEGSVSILLLQSVLLAASRVSENPSLYDSDGSNYLASCTFFQRAKALYDANYERDPLTLVQSLTLFTKFWEGLDDILGNSYYWSRIAITVAQGYGFHRTLNDTLSSHDKKIWKIVWWNLYIKDISTSVAFGRPKIIHLEDCDVEMIKSTDFPEDVSWEDSESFIQMIKLSEIMSIVLQEQYSAKAEKFRHRENWVITHCDMLMSSWRNNLPHKLQYTPNKEFPLSINCLNLYYYSAICLVHRSNMVKTATLHGKSYPSEGIVFQASRIIADIAATMLRNNQMKYCNAFIIPTLFTASMTFICHLESSNVSISKTAKLGFDVLFKALEEIGKNYLIATVIAHNMHKLATDNKARHKILSHLAKRSISEESGSNQSNIQTNPNPFPVQPLNASHENMSPTIQQQQQQQQGQPPQPHSQDATTSSSTQPTPQQQKFEEEFHKYPHQRVSMNHGISPQTSHSSQTPQESSTSTSTTSSSHLPPHQIPLMKTPAPAPTQPQQPDQFDQLEPPTNSLEFPDLYLFTNTLPSSSWNNFDPSDLFPATAAANSTLGTPSASTSAPNTFDPHGKNDSTTSGLNKSPTDGFNEFVSNGFDPNFNINLPEFDFQNFNNSISLQNLVSINDFFKPGSGSGTNTDAASENNDPTASRTHSGQWL